MHISGIVSGLDTDTLIEQLMAIERRPLVLMQERKTTLEKQRDAWRDVNTRLNNLRDRMAELSRLSLFERRAVTSSDAGVATATANRDAAEATYRIEVEQLAQAHRVASQRITDTAALQNEAGKITGKITVGGKVREFTFEEGDTLQTLADKINEADFGVAARIIDGRLIIEAKETGVGHQLSFSGDLFQKLGIIDESCQLVKENVLQKAQDAIFKVEGLTITRSS
ncbi:MAG: flagellar cap protein FliD N-terminal domain-containing protein, partial [Bacillota bacterium]